MEPPTMESVIKMSGYLEKKGSLKLISSWKKYWFVLEGQLLLYYRSKAEYDGISPCKGSVSLCPPCSIKPCSSKTCVFRIEKKTNSITLRAESRMEQDRWMQRLLMALKSDSTSQTRLSQYRFSSCDFVPVVNQRPLRRHLSLPIRCYRNSKKSSHNVEKPKKGGVHSYSIQMPKKLLRRYGSGGQLYASVDENPGKVTQDVENDKDVDFVRDNDCYGQVGERYSSILDERTSFVVNNEDQPVAKRRFFSDVLPTINTSNAPADDGVSGNNFDRNSSSHESVDRPRMSASSVLPERNIAGERAEVTNSRRLHGVNKMSPSDDVPPMSISTTKYECCATGSSEALDHNKNTIITENEQCVTNFLAVVNVTDEVVYDEIDEVGEKLIISGGDSVYAEITDGHFVAPFYHTVKCFKNNDESRLTKTRSFFSRFVLGRKKKNNTEMNQEEIDTNMKLPIDIQQTLLKRKELLERAVSESPKACQETIETIEDDTSAIQPPLPPKTTPKHSSPYHVTSKNNSAVFRIPDSSLSSVRKDTQKSIDQILDDLDKTKEEAANKPTVKQIIEKFNGYGEEEVVLREHKGSPVEEQTRQGRHSEELNELLEKLEKMTVAPVMEPGVTSSLASPPIDDDEWLKLLPIRRRRLSDPDYDVPRSHRFLVLQPKIEISENIIPATRFFGPVLQSSDLGDISKNNNVTYGSMSPDSLELIERTDGSVHTKGDKYSSLMSYSYFGEQSSHRYDVIMSHPKWIGVGQESVGSSNELLLDSLENSNELTTAF